MANYGKGNQVAFSLVNKSGMPLDGFSVATTLAEVIADKDSRYLGRTVFIEEKNCLYMFSKHKKADGTYTTGIEDDDLKPFEASGSGIDIVADYSKFTAQTANAIGYAIADYTDTSVSPSVTYGKGFYLWNSSDATPSWKLIGANQSDVEWQPSTAYNVGNVVLNGGAYYECITAHTSSTAFTDDAENWICRLEFYYHLSQTQYNKLKADGVINAANKYLYVVDSATAEWQPNTAYLKGDAVVQGDYTVVAIKDHTSSATFTDDEANWYYQLDTYYRVTSAQYKQLEDDGVITDDTKELYVISNILGAQLTSELDVSSGCLGIPTGTVYPDTTPLEEIIRDLLYTPPVVEVTFVPTPLLFKTGSTVNTIEITTNITKKSNAIKSLRVVVGGTVVYSVDSTATPALANGGTYVYDTATPITTETDIYVMVNDGQRTTTIKDTVKFIDPFYYGASATDSNITVADLTEVVGEKSNKTLAFTCNNEFGVFAYPESWGILTSIIDENGFENLYNFNGNTMVINGIVYYVYTTYSEITTSAYKYTFKF